MTRIPLTTLLWLLAAALLLGGCLRLEKPYPQKIAYALEAMRDAPPQRAGEDRVLQVGRFDCAPAYRGRGFVYRTGDQTWQSDYYHEFFIAPAAMLTEQSRRWLQQAAIFSQLNQGGYPPASDLLQGRIVALYGDFRPGRAPAAVLALQLTLLDERHAPPRTVLERLYQRRLPLADKTPATLVSAWNKALTEILAEFEAELRQTHHSMQQQGPAQ